MRAMDPFIFTMVLGLAILIACALIFLLKERHGLGDYFILGWGLQVLLSLPAGIWQVITGWGHLTFIPWSLIFMPKVGSWQAVVRWGYLCLGACKTFILAPISAWIFNMTGMSVKIVLGLSEYEFWRSRESMLWYLLAALVQGTALAWLFACRYGKRRTFKDWVVISLGILFLANSLANVDFCWSIG